MYSKTYVGRQVLVLLETNWLPQNEQHWTPPPKKKIISELIHLKYDKI